MRAGWKKCRQEERILPNRLYSQRGSQNRHSDSEVDMESGAVNIVGTVICSGNMKSGLLLLWTGSLSYLTLGAIFLDPNLPVGMAVYWG